MENESESLEEKGKEGRTCVGRTSAAKRLVGGRVSFGYGGIAYGLLDLEMCAPTTGERKKKSFGYYLSERIWNGLAAPFFNHHSRREGTDF